MPGVMLGYHVSSGGKWHGDYLVSPLQDFMSENAGGTLRVFRVKEVVVNSIHPVQFPMSPVKDNLERTVGPRRLTTTVKLVGIDEPVKLSTKMSNKCVHFEGEDVAEDVTREVARDEGA
eukprot:4434338-Heterocapsa_arctica.AAC.1